MKSKKDLYRKLFNITNDVHLWTDFHSKEEIYRRNNNLFHQCVLLMDSLPDSAIQLLCENPKCGIMYYTDYINWRVLINFSWEIDYSAEGKFDLGRAIISIDVGPEGIIRIQNKNFDEFDEGSIILPYEKYPIDLTKVDIQWPILIDSQWGLGIYVIKLINNVGTNAV